MKRGGRVFYNSTSCTPKNHTFGRRIVQKQGGYKNGLHISVSKLIQVISEGGFEPKFKKTCSTLLQPLRTTYLYKYNLENKLKPVLRTELITWFRVLTVNKQYNLIISWNSICVRKSS